MEDPSITKRLIDFGTAEHEYDEVQDLPEESTANNQSLLFQNNRRNSNSNSNSSNNNNDNNNTVNNNSNNNTNITGIPTTTSRPAAVDNSNNNHLELPPELPPPKQNKSSSVLNTPTKSGKTKTSSSSKSSKSSKIPRSPSLASTLSYNNFQPPPISGIPSQTPPLPLGYQSKGKGNLNPSTSPLASNNVSIFTNNSNNNINNNNNNNSNIMAGGNNSGNVGGSGSGSGGVGGLSTSNGNAAQRNSTNMSSANSRRQQIQISSPVAAGEPMKNFQFLTLTVRKDENGYGMKVSGDNPVFVESVKPGGAAQIAGLVAGDMILKVNGKEVRSEKHPTVVSLIKASTIVELAVKRSQNLARPTSVGIVPSTPVLSIRDRTASITGPQPVDSIKRREMETYKIITLQKMLEQEKLNLASLKGDTNNPRYKQSEANIKKLREQLRLVGAEDAPPIKTAANNNSKTSSSSNTSSTSQNPSSTHLNHHLNHHHLQHHNTHLNNNQQQQHHLHHHQHHSQATTPQPQPTQSSPAFLSLLPRSLSSLSLGGRRNKIDKDLITAPLNNTTDFMVGSTNATTTSAIPSYNMSQSLHTPLQTPPQRNSAQQLFHLHQQQLQQQQQQHQQQQQQQGKGTPKSTKSKNKFASQAKNLIEEDIPPPLPQRNPPRQLQLDNGNMQTPPPPNSHSFSPISDLDHTASSVVVVAGEATPLRNSPQPVCTNSGTNSPQNVQNTNGSNGGSSKSKRSKAKTKALSDPKMSTQLFLQMESAAGHTHAQSGDGNELEEIPPPLPPRQPGMLDESQLAGHRGSIQNLSSNIRPPPNSIDTLMQYPLVLGQTPHNLNHMNKHRRVVSSPDNMHTRHPERQLKTNSGSWELIEKDDEETPPGTPPPPYRHAHSASMSGNEDSMLEHGAASGGGIFVESHHFTPLAGAISPPPSSHSSRIQAAQTSVTQKEIISMEDEDASDQEGPFIDENGPFNSFQRLLEPENVAFLAVFLNYVLSNSEPAPLLFYLITALYKEGTSKDMRKWVYEIHSTFLVPRAPLAWFRQDESLARDVDAVLQNEYDKVEILRKVFWKSRKKARDIISEQLREFQQKRTAGLGTIYGPTDAQLMEAKGDKQKEQHIFEETLMKKLQYLIDEYEKDLPAEDPKKSALCSALSTVIHRTFITRSHPNSIIDRVHHFVSREKSFKSRLMGKKGKMIVRGHPLVLRQYYEVTHCNHCQTIIWGVSPQGFHCTDCKLNIHRPCSKILEENCPGPLPQAKRKDKDLHNDNKISKLMGKIRPKTSTDMSGDKRQRQDPEDMDPMDYPIECLTK
ncbi:hypothetical protein DOY81_007057 [Sarcophaga bullata]|nr:hypothetical protein DOY81_007057 [Sarcophaga bullata]